MSRHVSSLITAFLVVNIAFDLIGLLSASKRRQAEEGDTKPEKDNGNISNWALALLPFSAAYSIICFMISYMVLVLFRTLSILLAFLRFIGLAAANETKSSMLWTLAAARFLSGRREDAK